MSRRILPFLTVNAGERLHMSDLRHGMRVPPMFYFGLVLEGGIHNHHDGRDFDFTAGHFFAASLREPVEFQTLHPGGKKFAIVSILADRAWMEARIGDDRRLKAFAATHMAICTGLASSELLHSAARIMALIRDDSLSGLLHFEAASMEFLAAVTDMLSVRGRENPAERADARAMQIRARLDSVMPGEVITLEGLAREFSLSASSLSRRFRAAFGISIMAYLTERRLMLAKTALERGVMSIGEAAYLAGYSSPANFTVAFHRAFGLTPGRLRRI